MPQNYESTGETPEIVGNTEIISAAHYNALISANAVQVLAGMIEGVIDSAISNNPLMRLPSGWATTSGDLAAALQAALQAASAAAGVVTRVKAS